MKEHKNQTFKDRRLSPATDVRDRRFVKCDFQACRLSVPYTAVPEERTRIINCSFESCTFSGSTFQSKGLLQQVLLHNIAHVDYMAIGGVIFDRVTFKGRFDRWILDSDHRGMVVDFRAVTDEECAALDGHAQAAYRTIEWALDISDAEFKECELRPSVPAHLVKRNPETQMLMRHDKVVNSRWQENPALRGNRAEVFCRWVARTYQRDTIIVAPVRNKKLCAEYLEGMKILRGEGIGEVG